MLRLLTGPDMRPTFYQSLFVFSILIACLDHLGCCSASELTVPVAWLGR